MRTPGRIIDDIIGSAILARRTFNYITPEKRDVTVQFGEHRYSINNHSQLGYIIGVLTCPVRIVNYALDVPQEDLERQATNLSSN